MHRVAASQPAWPSSSSSSSEIWEVLPSHPDITFRGGRVSVGQGTLTQHTTTNRDRREEGWIWAKEMNLVCVFLSSWLTVCCMVVVGLAMLSAAEAEALVVCGDAAAAAAATHSDAHFSLSGGVCWVYIRTFYYQHHPHHGGVVCVAGVSGEIALVLAVALYKRRCFSYLCMYPHRFRIHGIPEARFSIFENYTERSHPTNMLMKTPRLVVVSLSLCGRGTDLLERIFNNIILRLVQAKHTQSRGDAAIASVTFKTKWRSHTSAWRSIAARQQQCCRELVWLPLFVRSFVVRRL